MRISRVDPDDHEALASYNAICTASESFENAYPTPMKREEQREMLRNKESATHVEGYLGYDEQTPVATGLLDLPLIDNVEKAWAFVDVLPEQRRHGYGAQMADFVLARARDAARTTVMTALTYPFDADESHPYRRFVAGRGFVYNQSDVHRVLHLPADEDLLDRLQTEAEPHHVDYTFAEYSGPLPESLQKDYCVLLNQILVDAPSGAVDFEEGRMTPEMLVERDEAFAASRRTCFTALGLDRDGVPVAHNVLVVPEYDPEQIFNFDTLVRRDHRGHRLGIATKVRNLRRVTAAHPDRTTVHTWNAESNRPMVAVNDAVGFVPVSYDGEYVLSLDPA